MSTRQYLFLLLTLILSSIIGSSAGYYLLSKQQSKTTGTFDPAPPKMDGYVKSIKTQEILLIAEDGKIRAKFYLGEHDAPNLILFDSSGTNRLNLGLAPAGNGGIEILGIDGERWTAP